MSHTYNIPTEQAGRLREQYRSVLFDDIVPWWEKHSIDRECGGCYSCLERDGRVYAGDKFMWMLGRQVWMFSHLYNNHEQRPEWLEIARHGARFMLEHAFTETGKMYFRLTREGKPLATCLSLYTECFATIALAELSKAAGDDSLWRRAVEMYERIRPRLGQPESSAMLGYPLNTQFHSHSHDMIRLTVAWVLSCWVGRIPDATIYTSGTNGCTNTHSHISQTRSPSVLGYRSSKRTMSTGHNCTGPHCHPF